MSKVRHSACSPPDTSAQNLLNMISSSSGCWAVNRSRSGTVNQLKQAGDMLRVWNAQAVGHIPAGLPADGLGMAAAVPGSARCPLNSLNLLRLL